MRLRLLGLVWCVGGMVSCGDSEADGEPAESSSGEDSSTRGTTTSDPDVDTTQATGSTGVPPTSSSGTTGGPSGSSSGGEAFEAGEDAAVRIVEDAHVFWLGWEDGENRREVDFEVQLPPSGPVYERVTLSLALSCPDGACDWWDRRGSLGLVENPGSEDERVLEILRFITPYRVGGSWQLDVTALQPWLTGDRTLRVFIDTWVGPGHQNGNGWIVDAQLDYEGGVPDLVPTEVIGLWPKTDVTVGDPLMPVSEQAGTVAVEVPVDADRVELWSVITGHGQGNADNCAEFCPLIHGYAFGGQPVQRTVWRDDCQDNPIRGQQGTWTLPRAGWCPGDVVAPWVEDVTTMVQPGTSLDVQYDLEGYENTCRPDAPVCSGCALGTGCEYDGGSHTAPVIELSAALVVYRDAQVGR